MQQVYNSLSKGTARSFTNQKRAQIQKIIESIGQADYMRALHASLMSLSQDMQRTNTVLEMLRWLNGRKWGMKIC